MTRSTVNARIGCAERINENGGREARRFVGCARLHHLELHGYLGI
jgi:hypothetical protein